MPGRRPEPDSSPASLRASAAGYALAAGEAVKAPRKRKPRAPGQRNAQPELVAQRAVVAWINMCVPGAMVAAAVNESRGRGKTKKERARYGMARKRSGVRSGWPDLTITLPGPRVLYVEMKAPGWSPSDVSQAQRDVHRDLRAQGIPVAVCASVDDVRAFLAAQDVATREVGQ